MSTQLLLRKALVCRNDWLPTSAGRFIAFNIALVVVFKLCGYVLAFDKSVIFTSHDWIYHSLWLPLHLTLARCASGIFARHVAAGKADLHHGLRAEFVKRVMAVTSVRGFLGALLLVAPLAYLDVRAGFEFVDENFASQGYAGVLIPVIWMIEWVATAQIWLYVLGSIYITPLSSHADNLRGRHVEVLVHGKGRESIQAGLENALVILLYGISTIGYVWYANGQLSDYLVLGVSTLLVLVCFSSALVQLRANLRSNLDAQEREVVRAIAAGAVPASPVATAVGAAPADALAGRIPYQFLVDSTDALYAKRMTRHQAVDARIRLLKLSLCMPLTAKDEGIAKPLADEIRWLIECEVRLSELGLGEIRSLSLRAGMPILAIAGKSLGGLIGLH
jgi:hypothetical protein